MQPIQSYVAETPAEQLLAELGSGASDIADLVPEIRQKLPELEPSPTLDPQQTRFRLFNSIATFLINLAQSHSLVLVLDDLHWADSPSLLLLEFLAQQMTDSKILVIGTYRDIEVTRRHPLSESLAQLSRSPAFSRLALTGLESDDVGQFVRESGGESASTELIDAIHSHTEGNPLFLSEVVRLLGEQKSFDAAGAGTAGTPIVLGLTMAAAIGRQFDFNPLKGLSEDASEIQLLEQVEEGWTLESCRDFQNRETATNLATPWCNRRCRSGFPPAAESGCTQRSAKRWRRPTETSREDMLKNWPTTSRRPLRYPGLRSW